MTTIKKSNKQRLFIQSAEVILEDIIFHNIPDPDNERIILEFEDRWELISNSVNELKLRVCRRLFSHEKESFTFIVNAIIVLQLDSEKTKKMSDKTLIKYINQHSGDVINPSGVMEKISYTIASVSLTFNNNPQFSPPFFYGDSEKEEIEKMNLSED